MRIIWHKAAWDEYVEWADPAVRRKIHKLIEDISRGGMLGKPEKLRNDLSGWSSRRINLEHRLIYCIRGDDIEILACREHYRRA